VDADNYLARGNWDDAAVEARRITKLQSDQARGDNKDDAYSRYVAGFCFEMAGDYSSARFEYRKAAALCREVHIDEQTGALSRRSNDVVSVAASDTHELVCLVALGRSPMGESVFNGRRSFEHPPYAEIQVNGRTLGRSYALADVAEMAFEAAKQDALKRMAKTAARVAVKETIAYQLDKEDELLGALARIILFGFLEQPDYRRWETLPHWFSVARVPCPPDLKEFDVIFKSPSGIQLGRQHIVNPLQKNGKVFVSFCRDIQPRLAVPSK
jgi:hypothetical protein